jgi:hypothetical protein
MRTVIAACCMVIFGSVAAHPEESSLKRYRVAQNRAQCLLECDRALAQCRLPNNQCNAAYAACQSGC